MMVLCEILAGFTGERCRRPNCGGPLYSEYDHYTRVYFKRCLLCSREYTLEDGLVWERQKYGKLRLAHSRGVR